MNKLKALEAFNEGGTDVAVGEEFLVNDEQQQRILREGKAERCADQSVDPATFHAPSKVAEVGTTFGIAQDA